MNNRVLSLLEGEKVISGPPLYITGNNIDS